MIKTEIDQRIIINVPLTAIVIIEEINDTSDMVRKDNSKET